MVYFVDLFKVSPDIPRLFWFMASICSIRKTNHLGLNPGITTYWLCDFTQITSLRPDFPICEMGSLGVADLLWIWMLNSTCIGPRAVLGTVKAPC